VSCDLGTLALARWSFFDERFVYQSQDPHFFELTHFLPINLDGAGKLVSASRLQLSVWLTKACLNPPGLLYDATVGSYFLL
jgi:hypothetical protein